MTIELQSVNTLLDYFSPFNIIPSSTKEQLARLVKDSFIFREQLDLAESLHLHIKVPYTGELPHENLLRYGGQPQNEKDGYIKYAFDKGINLIFSSIPVSQEEKAGFADFDYPHLDHIGIDIRKDDAVSYECFNKIPGLAENNKLPYKRQGGDGKNVYCCHVQVNEKYWVYPKDLAYFEFAFGPLVVSDQVFGCDLRPADPSLNIPEEQLACCSSDASYATPELGKTEQQAEGYYRREDLAKFGSIGLFQKDLADKFFAYYGDVFKEGALSAREKSLIALAVAHAVQCPYCIDAYSTDAVKKGYSKQQLMEAVHVAAAIRGGATLVHGVQMMNKVNDLQSKEH